MKIPSYFGQECFLSCQEERKEALAELKAIELKYNELKVLLAFLILLFFEEKNQSL